MTKIEKSFQKIIPILVKLMLTFLILSLEFLDKIVKTIKKAPELISEGIL